MGFASSFLIDDVGRERRWPDPRVAAQLGDSAPDFELADYAVRNLGYIAVALGPRAMRVRLRPALVAPPTIAALLTRVAERRPGRVAVSWLSDSWRHEVLGGTRATLDRLAEIFTSGVGDRVDGDFVATRRSLGAILATAKHAFAPILHRWLDGTCPDDLAAFLAAHGMLDRSSILERDRATGDFIFRYSGRGIRLYGAGWPDCALGRRVQDQPDPAYGRWVATSYRAVDDIQVARHELVHATIAGGRQRRRWRYERLLLPWRQADGHRLLVTVSTNVHVAEL